MKKLQMILLLLLMNCASGPVGGLLFTNYEYAGEVNPDSSIPILAEAKGMSVFSARLILDRRFKCGSNCE
jgi:hypothetical protein